MHLLSFFLLSMVVIKESRQLLLSDCPASSQRLPLYTDISVSCGTNCIDLAIQFCPVLYSGYNASLLLVNGNGIPGCQGTVDTTATPPVVRFKLLLNSTNSCGSIFRTYSAPGTGVFADFSNIQTVNISGLIRASDPTIGTVTYNTDIKYYYSCAYPLEYLINNTQLAVSASAIAVTDRNGSFISTLSIQLYSDINYMSPLVFPPNGVELRKPIYAQVIASNLTSQYNVLLDRCYASVSALPTNSTFFNLFVPCNIDPMTTMIANGVGQNARFSFPAFRFMEQQNQLTSQYYLHCIVRLCDVGSCPGFMKCNRRRRRAATDAAATDYQTISSPPITTQADTHVATTEQLVGGKKYNSNTGLGVAVGVLAFICILAIVVAAVFRRRLKH